MRLRKCLFRELDEVPNHPIRDKLSDKALERPAVSRLSRLLGHISSRELTRVVPITNVPNPLLKRSSGV